MTKPANESPKKEKETVAPPVKHLNLESGAMKKFNADISAMNFLKGDEKRTFPSTRLYIDDENKHLPNHIAFQNTVRKKLKIYYRLCMLSWCQGIASGLAHFYQMMR
jgi:hypothetical protein